MEQIHLYGIKEIDRIKLTEKWAFLLLYKGIRAKKYCIKFILFVIKNY